MLPSSVWGGFLQSLCVISDVPLKKIKEGKSDSCSGCRQGAPGLLPTSGSSSSFQSSKYIKPSIMGPSEPVVSLNFLDLIVYFFITPLSWASPADSVVKNLPA